MGKNNAVYGPSRREIHLSYDDVEYQDQSCDRSRSIYPPKMIRSAKYNFLIILALLYTSSPVIAQTDTDEYDGWQWLPSGITFRPVIASVYEPRVGFTFFGDDGFIRLDVGSGIDLIGRKIAAGEITIGVEFFIWTLLESWDNFHFPVIASDYFFGANLSYAKKVAGDGLVSARLRLTHISAHFVDGHFNKDEGVWRDGLNPRVYSREFIELLGSYQVNRTVVVRMYGGVSYIFSITPDWLGRIVLQTGGEIFLPTGNPRITPYAAYDLRFAQIEIWRPTHSIQLGIKLGNTFGRGIDLFGAYFSGMSVHGELFDQSISYWGAGFNIHI
jgi:hypothetical protein